MGFDRTGAIATTAAAPQSPVAPAAEAPSRPAKRGAGEVRRWRGWLSPLSRRILALNVLTLLIPVIGMLYLDQLYK
ncbi:MAG: sensor N-terminal transmembrane domain-containing protein, partial [Rhodospirillaceae bacterium]|nr:sensor N-terminal transmembrane domain-containing protein [Rhodospirillaceae bacterium]